MQSLKKALLIAAGSLALAVAVIGIFAPLIPTTGPLLIAAMCYARSSERLHTWLITHRVFGPYIRMFREHRAMPLRAKVWSIGTLWATLLLSMWLVSTPWVRPVLALVGIGVTWLILSFRTLNHQP